jgi:hypothetical protein
MLMPFQASMPSACSRTLTHATVMLPPTHPSHSPILPTAKLGYVPEPTSVETVVGICREQGQTNRGKARQKSKPRGPSTNATKPHRKTNEPIPAHHMHMRSLHTSASQTKPLGTDWRCKASELASNAKQTQLKPIQLHVHSMCCDTKCCLSAHPHAAVDAAATLGSLPLGSGSGYSALQWLYHLAKGS